MKKVIIISGATCSGKTALAINLALQLNTEIISADSRQIYKEIPIGTAQPTETELAKVKHHLTGFLSVKDDYNAGQFERDALAIIKDLFKNHNYVIVCGGTGLYINALINGFDEIPETDPEIRNELEYRLQNEGLISLQQELQLRDPEYAQIIDLSNPQRIIRALEVCIETGRPYSIFRLGKKASRDFDYIYYALQPERVELYNRINNRVHKMMESGLINEAEKMLPYRNFNALKTVGYSELFQYFDKAITIDVAIDKIKQHTRNYAKRQVTWLRKQPDLIPLPSETPETYILNDIKQKELQ